MFYTVTLLDKDGYELSVNHDVQGLKLAKETAKGMLTDPEYTDGAYKVEIHDDDDKIVWDKFK